MSLGIGGGFDFIVKGDECSHDEGPAATSGPAASAEPRTPGMSAEQFSEEWENTIKGPFPKWPDCSYQFAEDYAAYRCEQETARLKAERDELSKEVLSAFDIIFPYIPEASGEGGELLTLADKIQLLAGRFDNTEAEIARLCEALEDIAEPMWKIQADAKAEGLQINGAQKLRGRLA